MSGKQSYTHILKYTGMFGGVQGLNIAITLVRNKFVALLLGPAGMGLVALYSTIVNFFSQATSLGISFSAVRHVSELFDSGDIKQTHHFVKVVRGWTLLTALAGMFLLGVLGPLLGSSVFGWEASALDFILLSPVIAMTAITGGETAILKGARMLKPLATIQVLTMITALIVTVPVYYFFGITGIIPVFLILAFVTMMYTLRSSCKYFPYRLRGVKGILGEGTGMVKLGIAFVLAGVFGSGSELVIRSFLNVEGGLDVVGLYNAGYMLTITYAGMVFSAMDTDYFPRLSAAANDTRAIQIIANRQIEMSLLLVSPMLAALIVLLPIILPLLYSICFAEIIPMGQIAVFSMYFKAVTLSLEYINLAKGNSKDYLMLEIVYDVLVAVFIVYGYRTLGLWGTGLALTLCHLLNLIVVLIYSRVKYNVSLSKDVLTSAAIHLPLGIIAYATTFIQNFWMHWTLSIITVAVSAAISLYIIIYKKTSVWDKIKNKISRHD